MATGPSATSESTKADKAAGRFGRAATDRLNDQAFAVEDNEMDRSELNALMLAARKFPLQGKHAEVLAEIDAALDGVTDAETRGELLLSRAVANQVGSDPGPSAADALAALDAIRDIRSLGLRAAASAIAAGFVLQAGDLARSVDLAVDAMVILAQHDGSEPGDPTPDLHMLRANNALSVLFSRLAAFELAVEATRAAWRVASSNGDPNVGAIVAYNLCSCGLERLRASDCGEAEQAGLIDDIKTAIEYLCESTIEQAHRVVGPGMRAELALLGHEDPAAIEALVSNDISDLELPPQVSAWHCLVRSIVASRSGDLTQAAELIDDALTILRLPGAEEHNVLRAMRQRADVRQAIGDLAGAADDLRDMVDRLHRVQRQQVGRLSVQIRRRAEGEIARAKVRHEAAMAAEAMATDEVTGVGTRRWLERQMEELARTDAFGIVIMLDLDHFKAVNDTYGHVAGDRVLRRFGSLLKHSLRQGDLVARYGGEEFMIILPDTFEETGTQLAQRIEAQLQTVDWSDIADITVTASGGIAGGPLSELSALVALADKRLYQAKRDGRDRIVSAPT